MTKKFNWGTGILITFILFMSSVLIQVFFYMNTDVDLVTDNYYEKELNYEDHLIKLRNTGNLDESINVEYTGEEISISFPAVYDPEKITGSLLFYRPSDSSKDTLLKILTDKANIQRINTKNFSAGYWKLKVDWEYEAQTYYIEKTLLLN